MRRNLLLLICSLLIGSAGVFAQTQKGSDIDGESAEDRSGYSISMPDKNTIAIGAPNNDGRGADAGHVRIYRWDGQSWSLKGQDLDGEYAGDLSGHSVSMPDSNTIAVGAYKNYSFGVEIGNVQIYRWNGSTWKKKGWDIVGEYAYDWSGYSVSMPDSNTVAIGAIYNDGNGSGSGHVRIYQWFNSTGDWYQKGQDINGEAAGDNSGWSVSMPDNNTVAIGARSNDGNGVDAGHVRVFRWTGTSWVQKGIDIDGEAAGDWFGHSVCMPNSNTLAVGGFLNDGNGISSGHVKVFNWNGTTWLQKGNDIDGEAPLNLAGYSLSMPNENVIAVGEYGSNKNGSYSGQVRIYNWNGFFWMKRGIDLVGEAANNYSGFSVSMPDSNTLGVGAIFNSSNGIRSGHVRVHQYCITESTIYPKTCGSYTSPSGNYIWTKSGLYYDRIPNAENCDSIISIFLTIDSLKATIQKVSPTLYAYSSNNNSSLYYNWIDCDSNNMIIPGEYGQSFTATKSGNYAVVISNYYGCVDTSDCMNVIKVGLQENYFDQMSVFPNPTNGVVTIDLLGINQQVYLKVNGIDGQLVYEKQNNGTDKVQIDLSPYPAGIYFLSIQNEESVKVIKLVKE
jgi:hypothetical protein